MRPCRRWWPPGSAFFCLSAARRRAVRAPRSRDRRNPVGEGPSASRPFWEAPPCHRRWRRDQLRELRLSVCLPLHGWFGGRRLCLRGPGGRVDVSSNEADTLPWGQGIGLIARVADLPDSPSFSWFWVRFSYVMKIALKGAFTKKSCSTFSTRNRAATKPMTQTQFAPALAPAISPALALLNKLSVSPVLGEGAARSGGLRLTKPVRSAGPERRAHAGAPPSPSLVAEAGGRCVRKPFGSTRESHSVLAGRVGVERAIPRPRHQPEQAAQQPRAQAAHTSGACPGATASSPRFQRQVRVAGKLSRHHRRQRRNANPEHRGRGTPRRRRRRGGDRVRGGGGASLPDRRRQHRGRGARTGRARGHRLPRVGRKRRDPHRPGRRRAGLELERRARVGQRIERGRADVVGTRRGGARAGR